MDYAAIFETKGYEPSAPHSEPRPETTLVVLRKGKSYQFHSVALVGVLSSSGVSCVCGFQARGQWNAVAGAAQHHLRTAPLIKKSERSN